MTSASQLSGITAKFRSNFSYRAIKSSVSTLDTPCPSWRNVNRPCRLGAAGLASTRTNGQALGTAAGTDDFDVACSFCETDQHLTQYLSQGAGRLLKTEAAYTCCSSRRMITNAPMQWEASRYKLCIGAHGRSRELPCLRRPGTDPNSQRSWWRARCERVQRGGLLRAGIEDVGEGQ